MKRGKVKMASQEDMIRNFRCSCMQGIYTSHVIEGYLISVSMYMTIGQWASGPES